MLRSVLRNMSDYKSCEIKCPFYLEKQNDNHRIKCEGPEKNTSIQVTFVGEKGWYLKYFCSEKYEHCKIYKMLLEKYNSK